MATPPSSMRRLPAQPTSFGSIWSTAASPSCRWSRAWRSALTTRRASASPSRFRPRAFRETGTTLAKILNVPAEKVRILTANVGGSFGMKSNINYPEYICILHAAKALGRPVKWTDERSTSFLSDSHGRGQIIHGELALDTEGKFLAVRLNGYGDLGAYITGVSPGPLSLNTGKNLASVYRTPLLGVDIKTVLTNTTLMGAYRGAGRPEQVTNHSWNA